MTSAVLAPGAKRFRALAAVSLVYTTGVILWGALVRITGSGAGCGQHWPTCHGDVVPRSASFETLIEFTHRWTSGLCMLLVVATVVVAVRTFPKGHRARLGAWLSLFFVILEALIGAGLVLLEYVAGDDSAPRALWMAGHLLNTYLLTGAMYLAWWWGAGDRKISFVGKGAKARFVAVAAIGLAVVSMSGAITALGDTLYPIADGTSLADRVTGGGLGHYLVRFRIVHPMLAVGMALVLVSGPWNYVKATQRKYAVALASLAIVQVLFGALNIYLSAPGFMQLGHLLLALAVWLSLVRFGAEVLSDGDAR